MKYSIKNAIIINGDIVGYEVTNDSDVVKHIKLDDIFKLIERGLTDCRLVTDDKGNKHIVFPDNREEKTQDSDEYTVECRIKTNGEISGYKCRNEYGTILRIKPVKLWELAALNKVTNINAIIVNNNLTLEGKGITMDSLAVLEL